MRRAAAALLVLALLAGCSGGDNDRVTFGKGDKKVVVGGDVPGSFPDDIPLPDGTKFVFEDKPSDTFQFDVPGELKKLQAFYDDAGLPGYQVESSGDEVVDDAVADLGFIANWDGGEITAMPVVDENGGDVLRLQFVLDE